MHPSYRLQLTQTLNRYSDVMPAFGSNINQRDHLLVFKTIDRDGCTDRRLCHSDDQLCLAACLQPVGIPLGDMDEMVNEVGVLIDLERKERTKISLIVKRFFCRRECLKKLIDLFLDQVWETQQYRPSVTLCANLLRQRK